MLSLVPISAIAVQAPSASVRPLLLHDYLACRGLPPDEPPDHQERAQRQPRDRVLACARWEPSPPRDRHLNLANHHSAIGPHSSPVGLELLAAFVRLSFACHDYSVGIRPPRTHVALSTFHSPPFRLTRDFPTHRIARRRRNYQRIGSGGFALGIQLPTEERQPWRG